MSVTRNDSRWPHAVHEELTRWLQGAPLAEELRVYPLRTWVQDRFVHVLYRKKSRAGIYGLRRDTTRSVTGSEWEDPEEVAHEIAFYDLWEPHEQAPEEFVSANTVYWRGDVADAAHLPQRVDEAPAT